MGTHSWKEIYLLAISEEDMTRLPQRIRDARCAILDRVEEVVNGPGDEERRLLNQALNGLRSLKRESEREDEKKAS